MRKGTVMLLGATAFVVGLVSALALPARVVWARSQAIAELQTPFTRAANEIAAAYHVSSSYLSTEFKEVILETSKLPVHSFSIVDGEGTLDFALLPPEDPATRPANLDLSALYYHNFTFVFPGRTGFRFEFAGVVLDRPVLFIYIRDSFFGLAGAAVLLLVSLALYPRGVQTLAPARAKVHKPHQPSGRIVRWDFPANLPVEEDLSDDTLAGLENLAPRSAPVHHQETPEHVGLYDPDTGLRWSDHLENRLDLELKRAASYDQDLSLVVLSGPGRGARSLSAQAIAHFGFEDLCYEWGVDLMAVILPNHDLDAAVTSAKEFVSKHRAAVPLRAGIGSRNGRLLTGQRLLKEAERALSKADTSDTVVGFLIDPAKYRQFISGSSS